MADTLAQDYCKGKTPFRTWFFSCAMGAVALIVGIIYYHTAPIDFRLILNFIFALLINMIFTLPIFFAQSHFVCNALYKQKKNVLNVMLVMLISGWLFEFLLGFSIYKLFLVHKMQFGGQLFLIVNFMAMLISWTLHSLRSIRKAN